MRANSGTVLGKMKEKPFPVEAAGLEGVHWGLLGATLGTPRLESPKDEAKREESRLSKGSQQVVSDIFEQAAGSLS